MPHARWLVALPFMVLLGLLAGCRAPAREAQPGISSARTDVVEERWPNGVWRLRKEVLRNPDGTTVDQGAHTRWYDNGQVEYQATFVHGQVDGVATSYHRNGQKAIEQHFANGVRQGPRYNWDDQGRLRKEEHFVDDKPDGTWTAWDAEGKIEGQQHFEHGAPKS